MILQFLLRFAIFRKRNVILENVVECARQTCRSCSVTALSAQESRALASYVVYVFAHIHSNLHTLMYTVSHSDSGLPLQILCGRDPNSQDIYYSTSSYNYKCENLLLFQNYGTDLNERERRTTTAHRKLTQTRHKRDISQVYTYFNYNSNIISFVFQING